jgi:PPP family 3-phenylpropionic acid transporter
VSLATPALTARLGAAYFFHYAAVGLFMPYIGAWLASRGQGAAAIGTLLAAITAMRIVVPPFWAWLADRSGRRIGLVRWSSLAALAGGSLFIVAPDYTWLVVGALVFATFWNAAMPQIEVTTLAHLGAERQRYAGIRLWGSVGFIVTVVGGGALFEARGLASFPWVFCAALALVPLAVWRLPEAPPLVTDRADAPGLWAVLRQPRILVLFATLAAMQVSFGPYYGFFTLYLQGHGYGRDTIGLLWALGVLAEVGVFAIMPRLYAWASPLRWLGIAAVLTAVRWLVIALFADNMALLIAAQVLHLASFGIYHAVAVHLILEAFDGRLAGRGQALHSSIAYGLGGALGVWGAGQVWEAVSPAATFLAASAVTLGAVAGAWWLMNDDHGRSAR